MNDNTPPQPAPRPIPTKKDLESLINESMTYMSDEDAGKSLTGPNKSAQPIFGTSTILPKVLLAAAAAGIMINIGIYFYGTTTSPSQLTPDQAIRNIKTAFFYKHPVLDQLILYTDRTSKESSLSKDEFRKMVVETQKQLEQNGGEQLAIPSEMLDQTTSQFIWAQSPR